MVVVRCGSGVLSLRSQSDLSRILADRGGSERIALRDDAVGQIREGVIEEVLGRGALDPFGGLDDLADDDLGLFVALGLHLVVPEIVGFEVFPQANQGILG